MALSLDQTLAPDAGQSANSLILVTSAATSAWRAGQSSQTLALADAHRFTGRPGDVLLLPDGDQRCSAVVGVEDPLHPWSLAAAVAKLPAGTWRCASDWDSQAAIGWALAHYRFDRYLKPASDERLRTLLLPTTADRADLLRQVRAIALVRDLVNTPANDLGPEALAKEVQALAARHGAQVRVIVGDDLLDQGYPAIHAVGRAATQLPRLIDLTWGDPGHPQVTLIGKGVCFDSGGLDLKTASGMALMKKDMGGGAHALALAGMIMDAGLPVQLRLLIPAVENAVSGNAFRPGDILATRAGISVEIGNTDAEGRVILCDALAEADRQSPDLLIDFATLTGAARVALGPDLPALFTPDDGLAADLSNAGVETADPLWRLPLWQPYADYLKSSVADINNAGDSSFAGAITAALFLQRFVRQTPRWVHIDLFAWTPTTKPGRPKGGEAMTLRAILHLLKQRYGVI
jgi:leucyl aminopeptidase